MPSQSRSFADCHGGCRLVLLVFVLVVLVTSLFLPWQKFLGCWFSIGVLCKAGLSVLLQQDNEIGNEGAHFCRVENGVSWCCHTSALQTYVHCFSHWSTTNNSLSRTIHFALRLCRQQPWQSHQETQQKGASINLARPFQLEVFVFVLQRLVLRPFLRIQEAHRQCIVEQQRQSVAKLFDRLESRPDDCRHGGTR